MQKISITQLSGYDVRDANDGGVTITATALTIQHVHTNTHTHRVELTHFLLCRSRLGEQHNDAYGLINCSTHTHAHTHTNTIQLWLTDMLLCVVRDTDTGTLTNTQHTTYSSGGSTCCCVCCQCASPRAGRALSSSSCRMMARRRWRATTVWICFPIAAIFKSFGDYCSDHHHLL